MRGHFRYHRTYLFDSEKSSARTFNLTLYFSDNIIYMGEEVESAGRVLMGLARGACRGSPLVHCYFITNKKFPCKAVSINYYSTVYCKFRKIFCKIILKTVLQLFRIFIACFQIVRITAASGQEIITSIGV